MRAILQRTKESSVMINDKIVGSIEKGIVVLVGFTDGDKESDLDYVVNKLIYLRIFDDEDGIMNKSLIDVGGSVLSISQFTLYADIKKGRRPSYKDALEPNIAIELYELFNKKLREKKINVATGQFGQKMKVNITNDGPVTIIIESKGCNDKK